LDDSIFKNKFDIDIHPFQKHHSNFVIMVNDTAEMIIGNMTWTCNDIRFYCMFVFLCLRSKLCCNKLKFISSIHQLKCGRYWFWFNLKLAYCFIIFGMVATELKLKRLLYFTCSTCVQKTWQLDSNLFFRDMYIILHLSTSWNKPLHSCRYYKGVVGQIMWIKKLNVN
jgi:hypothetical protein